MNKKITAILFALLAAAFYAVNIPCSKLLLGEVSPTFMASFLYFGAALGIGLLYLIAGRKQKPTEKLTKSDLPYTIGMIVLDIAAPIFLMLGIQKGTASSATLLSNFEIVTTAFIALILFKESISKRLWLAIGLITVSGVLLTVEDFSTLRFSSGSLFVVLATFCWGLKTTAHAKLPPRVPMKLYF